MGTIPWYAKSKSTVNFPESAYLSKDKGHNKSVNAFIACVDAYCFRVYKCHHLITSASLSWLKQHKARRFGSILRVQNGTPGNAIGRPQAGGGLAFGGLSRPLPTEGGHD